MGLFLSAGFLIGLAIGGAISIVMLILAIIFGRKFCGQRRFVLAFYLVGIPVFSVLLGVLAFAIPFPELQGGGDYDVALEHLFERGFLFGMTGGAASLATFLLSFALPIAHRK